MVDIPRLPPITLGNRAKSTRTKYIGRVVGMLLSAKPDCPHCRGTGWVADFRERCLRRCSCADVNEIVTGD